MKAIFYTLFFFLLAQQICLAQGTWTKIGDMPEIRYAHTADEIYGKVYITGGVNTEQGAYPTTMLVYEKATSTWTTIPLPGNSLRGQHTSCVVDSNLYIIGGGILLGGTVNSTDSMYMFKPSTGEWIAKNPMPTDRQTLACALLDGKIYVAGGLHVINGVPNYNGLKTFEVYDLATETWSTLPDMPRYRWGLSIVAFEGKIYVFGGRGISIRHTAVDVYDPQDSSWTPTPVTNIPTPRYQLATCVVDSNIYAIDGWYSSGSGPIYDIVEVYNPITDVWTIGTSMPVAVAMLDGYALDGKIYMYGGSYTTHPNIGISDIWEFTPPIVPVELTSFIATSNGREVILNWSTATETNNQGFEIERASSMTSPVQEWENIGYIPGFGTTTEPKSYSYTDQSVTNGTFYYRLKQVDYNGGYEYSDVVEVNLNVLTEYGLQQNFPNPFNPTTTIGFGLQNKSNVKIIILNAIGEEVAALLNEEREPGYHTVEFNAANLPSGVYFYRLQAGSFVQTRKMILLK